MYDGRIFIWLSAVMSRFINGVPRNGCYLPACHAGILVRRESGGLECAAGCLPSSFFNAGGNGATGQLLPSPKSRWATCVNTGHEKATMTRTGLRARAKLANVAHEGKKRERASELSDEPRETVIYQKDPERSKGLQGGPVAAGFG